jgi:hypothetical protein
VNLLRSKKTPGNKVKISVDGSGTVEGDAMLKVPVASAPGEKTLDETVPMPAIGAPDPEDSWSLKSNVWMPGERIPSQAITAEFAQTFWPLKNIKTDWEEGVVPQSVPMNFSPVFAAAVKSKTPPPKSTVKFENRVARGAVES